MRTGEVSAAGLADRESACFTLVIARGGLDWEAGSEKVCVAREEETWRR